MSEPPPFTRSSESNGLAHFTRVLHKCYLIGILTEWSSVHTPIKLIQSCETVMNLLDSFS